MVGAQHSNKLSALILESSIRRRASTPLYFHKALDRSNSEKDKFLCPYLWDFKGPVLYLSSQLLFLIDIKELFACFNEAYTVQVFHSNVLMGITHPIIVFNSEKCRQKLSYEFVNSTSIETLEHLNFLSKSEIGYLPNEFLSLEPRDTSKIISYQNIPKSQEDASFTALWMEEYDYVFQSLI